VYDDDVPEERFESGRGGCCHGLYVLLKTGSREAGRREEDRFGQHIIVVGAGGRRGRGIEFEMAQKGIQSELEEFIQALIGGQQSGNGEQRKGEKL
jgi:hypothetical protein